MISAVLIVYFLVTNHPKTQWVTQLGWVQLAVLLLVSLGLTYTVAKNQLAVQLGQLVSAPWGLIIHRLVQVGWFHSRGVPKNKTRQSSNTQALFKPLFASHWLISHWPKQVTRPNSEKLSDERHQVRDTGRLMHWKSLLPPSAICVYSRELQWGPGRWGLHNTMHNTNSVVISQYMQSIILNLFMVPY